jgi:hypothetical protein
VPESECQAYSRRQTRMMASPSESPRLTRPPETRRTEAKYVPGVMPCLCSGTKSRAPTEVEWIHGAASTLPVMRLVPCVAVPKRQCKTTLRSRYSRGRNTVLISRWCRRRSDYGARTCGYRILLARARSQHRLFRGASERRKTPGHSGCNWHEVHPAPRRCCRSGDCDFE